MVFFNYATMQMAAKIVYYGPGLCGKTTNLHHIYGKTAPSSRGEMISLETETDRTLFFDLLPIDVGVIGGFKTRLQLYTVPGQVFYNTTRKLVLRGVDGIVFVADSQRAMLDANVESFRNMETNLQEIGLSYEDIPLILQFNKRDLAAILSVDELRASLDPTAEFAYIEASALRGQGVFETLKEISKLTLRSLKRKMMGEEKPARRRAAAAAAPPSAAPSVEPGPPAVEASPAPTAEAVRPAEPPAAPEPVPPPAAEEPRVSLEDLRAEAEAAASALAAQMDADGFFGREEAPAQETAPARPAEGVDFIAPSGEETEEIELEEATEEPTPADRATEDAVVVDFEETAQPAPVEAIKHVKVRSNVDILSELEKLRKNATLTPLPGSSTVNKARRRGDTLSVDDLLSMGLNHRKEVQRLVEVEVDPRDLGQARRLKLTVQLRGEGREDLGPEKTVEIDLANMKDIQKLLVSLKLDMRAK
jgi:signal recognition particle receptor subunit beta